MICANFSFSWNSNSATASKSTDRSVNVLRRYFLNAFSAAVNRLSISVSSNGENSFSFSPIAGLIDAIAIELTKRACSIEQRWKALSSPRWQVDAALPPNFILRLQRRASSRRGEPIPPTVAGLLESERDRANQRSIGQPGPGERLESRPPRWSRDHLD